MVAKPRLARTLFFAALALYVVWIGALVVLAAATGARPGDRAPRGVAAPSAAPADLAPAKE